MLYLAFKVKARIKDEPVEEVVTEHKLELSSDSGVEHTVHLQIHEAVKEQDTSDPVWLLELKQKALTALIANLGS